SGVDPHEYQLTYGDIEVLKGADIIVSTAHTSFELRIKELISAGELNAKLVEIPSIPGLVLLKNPYTNTLNYHGMLFHGYNYIAFLRYLSNILSSIRPECANIYNSKVEVLINRIERIEPFKPLRGLRAVIDTPVLQYLVSWLGANVTYILAVEHDVPIIPHDISETEKILELSRQEAVVVVTEDSLAHNLLKELALKYGVNFLAIPNPITSTQSVLAYLENIAKECQNLSTSKLSEVDVFNINLKSIILIISIAIIILVVVLLIPRVKL
ncbi:MAG: zinc ABC transporter substrate-binding protein, partial [Ignisphaera sp.]